MASHGLRGGGEAIELGLRDSGRREDAGIALADTLKPVLDQALSLIADCVAACGDANGPLGMIQECRAILGSAASPSSLIDICGTALEACRQILARNDATESARRRQMVELVELVREAMSALTGDHESFDGGLTASADRFDAMLQLESLTLIKIQLTREIAELRRMTEERQKSWSATLAKFASRITELEDQLAETEQQAASDPLTGLNNRAIFDKGLKDLASRFGSHFALALVDVDNFKHVNDTYGHLAGDQVLTCVANSLRAAFRSDDIVARHGGDEFAVLIKDVTMRQAETRMLTAIDNISFNRPDTDDGQPIMFTMSAGIAEYSAGDTTRSVLQRADEALYEAKRAGKNRVIRKEQAYLRDLRRKK